MPGNTNCDVERTENHEDIEDKESPDTEAEYERDSRDDVELLPCLHDVNKSWIYNLLPTYFSEMYYQ